MLSRASAVAVCVSGFALWAPAASGLRARSVPADLVANGTTLTVTTTHSVATFVRGDLVGLENLLTGEIYLRNPSAGELANVETIVSTGQALQASNWTIAPAPGTGEPVASITLSDSVRMLLMSVRVDPASDEIIVRTNGSASTPGLRATSWSLAGLDLQEGRLIVPAQSGQVFDLSYPGIGTSLGYPDMWNAQMTVYEAAAGSVVLYSTDQTFAFKRLRTSTRGNTTIDVAIGTNPAGPYASATTTPQIEWRLKAFAGDWQVAANAYRTWLNANRPPASTAAYPWVSSIRAVVTVLGLDTNLLAPLAAALVPAETLLYIVQWRSDGYDVDYPDYTPAPGAAAFVTQAKALGFRVMLHTDLIGVSPGNPDYPGVQAFHVRDPETLQLLGWRWNEPPSTPYRFAYINPASAAYRNLFVTRVGVAVAALQPDALHLDISSPTFNDGNGIIEGRNYPAGSEQLHQAIRTAFPSVALSGEGENDVVYPYQTFAQVLTYTEQTPPPGHPITAYLFAPSVQFYGHLSTPKPTESEFGRWLLDTITRGSAPTLRVSAPSDVDTSIPEIARMVAFHQSWQTHDFRLFTGDWQGDLARWEGNGGVTASLTDQANLLTVTAANGTLLQVVRGANRVATPRFVRGWPAFDDGWLFGLDPKWRYWLDALPRPTTTHVTSLPLGVKVDSATTIGNRFAHVSLTPVEAVAFDALANLLSGVTGVRFQGVDTPLGNGAVVNVQSITAGGISRSGLFIHPPYQGQVGGETFIEYQVPVPRAAVLRFGVAVADNATCTDGVTFRVTANGAEVWSQHLTRTGWLDVTLGLSAYSGSTVALRLTSHPGLSNNASCDWAVWNDVRVEAASTSTTAIAVPVALGPGAVYSGFQGNGLPAVVSPSSLSVSNMPVPGRFTVFTAPGSAVGAGTSLTALPFQAWLRMRGELARLGSVFDSGTISSGAASGVFKSPTVNAHPPNDGQTVLTWVLQLPAGSPLRLGWAAGILDGGATTDGIDFEVRINGVSYWRLTTSANVWTPGSLDLSPWQGGPILLELVTDSRAMNNFDWAHWADLTITSQGTACSYIVPAGTAVGSSAAAGAFNVTTAAGCTWVASSSQPWLTVSPPTSGQGNGTLNYAVAPNFGGPRTGAVAIAGQMFTVTQAAGSANLIQNGGFDTGLNGWQTFATPDLSYIVASVNGGVLEFYRQPPPAGTNQATVFQQTGVPVVSGGGLEARFDLGNSSTARKRVSVLMLNADFSDLSVCTFWLAPGAPLNTYRMRTHATRPWTNAALYFYAATAGASGGAYLLDNVSVYQDPMVAADRTECLDPTAPLPVAVADGPPMLVNGDFETGLAPWGLFGQIVQQITAGVFEFFRPAGTPAGVLLQNTLQAVAANQVLTATFDLGNSSAVWKRVTVLLHDNDFSDLTACTFWLPPGLPLSPFAMRGFTTKAWTASTLSVYPATVGTDPWIRLDNVVLRRTPSTGIAGTVCLEPSSSPPPASIGLQAGTDVARRPQARSATRSAQRRRMSGRQGEPFRR